MDTEIEWYYYPEENEDWFVFKAPGQLDRQMQIVYPTVAPSLAQMDWDDHMARKRKVYKCQEKEEVKNDTQLKRQDKSKTGR